MSLAEIIEKAIKIFNMNAPFIIVVLLVILRIFTSVIEILPIQIDPFGGLKKWFRNLVNDIRKEDLDRVNEKLTSMETDLTAIHTELKDLHEKIDETRAIDARHEIVRMGDEILQGTPHSKDMFDECLHDIKYYENHCATHPDFKNNVIMMSIENIKDTYKKCLKHKTFLDNGDSNWRNLNGYKQMIKDRESKVS